MIDPGSRYVRPSLPAGQGHVVTAAPAIRTRRYTGGTRCSDHAVALTTRPGQRPSSTKTRRLPDGADVYHYLEIVLDHGRTRKVRVDRDLWKSVSKNDISATRAALDTIW